MNINFMRDLLDIYIFPTLTFCELSLPLSPLFSSLLFFLSRLSLHFVSRKVTIHLKLNIKSGYDRSTDLWCVNRSHHFLDGAHFPKVPFFWQFLTKKIHYAVPAWHVVVKHTGIGLSMFVTKGNQLVMGNTQNVFKHTTPPHPLVRYL